MSWHVLACPGCQVSVRFGSNVPCLCLFLVTPHLLGLSLWLLLCCWLKLQKTWGTVGGGLQDYGLKKQPQWLHTSEIWKPPTPFPWKFPWCQLVDSMYVQRGINISGTVRTRSPDIRKRMWTFCQKPGSKSSKKISSSSVRPWAHSSVLDFFIYKTAIIVEGCVKIIWGNESTMHRPWSGTWQDVPLLYGKMPSLFFFTREVEIITWILGEKTQLCQFFVKMSKWPHTVLAHLLGMNDFCF